MNTTVPTKQVQFKAFLDRGSVFVHLDPRRAGVSAPASITARPRVVLQIKRALTIPLPDISIDDDAVRVTLSFHGEPFRCVIPWSAMFSLVADNGEVTVWPTELPGELAPDRGPAPVTGTGLRASVHPGHPVSLPPPALTESRSRRPSRAPSRRPSRVPVEARASQRPASVIPGSLAAALRIPRAPAVPASLPFAHGEEEPPRGDRRRSDSTPAASRAMRANDSMSIVPQRLRDDE